MRIERERQAARRRTLALSWSGGKDSALALWELRRGGIEPCALLATVTERYRRVSMHGVRRELVQLQADATRLPLAEVSIPPECPNEVYEARMAQALYSVPLREVDEVAFGDLYLEDVRAYREQRLEAAGRRAAFPLWGRDTSRLARSFLHAGFEAVVVCVDPRRLDPRFAGRSYDARLLAELPPDVDPCGENGEFHTFVHAGPVFERPVPCRIGDTVTRGGFTFCELFPRAPR